MLGRVRTEVAKGVVGQDAAVTGLVIALLCRGHVLLEGVPGVAKTLLVRTLAAALALETKRVQFTPDLMPGDITGSLVYDARTAEFSFRQGPVFTNLLLADEINRTPPKTQASLLEAMEERQVSVDGAPRPLPDPFLVIATQNPVEYEGTYPLPEAQLDRFLLKLVLPLPERDQEIEVLARHAAGFDPRDLAGAGVRPVGDADDARRAGAPRSRRCRSRPRSSDTSSTSAGRPGSRRRCPSASRPAARRRCWRPSRAWAWLSGRAYVTPDDVKALAHPTLRHRVQLRPEAELEGVSAETVLSRCSPLCPSRADPWLLTWRAVALAALGVVLVVLAAGHGPALGRCSSSPRASRRRSLAASPREVSVERTVPAAVRLTEPATVDARCCATSPGAGAWRGPRRVAALGGRRVEPARPRPAARVSSAGS